MTIRIQKNPIAIRRDAQGKPEIIRWGEQKNPIVIRWDAQGERIEQRMA